MYVVFYFTHPLFSPFPPQEKLSQHKSEMSGLSSQLEAEVSKVEKAERKEAAMEEANRTLQLDRKEVVCVCVCVRRWCAHYCCPCAYASVLQ